MRKIVVKKLVYENKNEINKLGEINKNCKKEFL